jgi:transposase-like protein
MAEGQRMTVADVVAQTRDGRLEDFAREAVMLVARELMEAEISEQVGAGHGEVAPEARVTHRNGYRARPWETRVGEIELLIPRARQGSYFPSLGDGQSRRSSRWCWRRMSTGSRPGRLTGWWSSSGLRG